MPDYQTILYTADQSVATITINRPERRNAITQEMLSELLRAFTRAGDDDAVRAIVLTGATFAGQAMAYSWFTTLLKSKPIP